MKTIALKGWLAALLLVFTATGYAAGKNDIYTSWFSDKAVSGYDTVAFFTQKKPVKGSSDYKFNWKGVVWLFSSEKHLDMFRDAPEKYAPQYGGYCAWAIAVKADRAPGDPNFWRIVNGKLYLNYDRSVQDKWLKDIPGFIKQGDINWQNMTNDRES
ncbi:YHS domain-containing (seleno)protein [Endozoicomonadaceae bacterium StTr2]